jgi:hypothetical protein
MYAIIACGVFKHEIERISSDLEFPFEVHYLGSGLHVDFDDLEEALKSELEKCKGCEGTVVVYGECHPKMADILGQYKAVLIDCQNCVDAFLTRKGVAERSSQGLYFYLSPGWIECWREIFSSLNWTQEEARLQLGPSRERSSWIRWATPGVRGGADEVSGLHLLPYQVVPVDLTHFKSLITSAKRSWRSDLGRARRDKKEEDGEDHGEDYNTP